MRKEGDFLVIVLFFILVFSFASVFANADSCNLGVSLVNQDPYPAVQGDTVKLLFQMSGVGNPECRGATFKLDPDYAFSFTENDSIKTLIGGTYAENYKSYWTIPYTLKVNKDAPDGDNQIEVYYSPGPNINYSKVVYSKFFNISIQDSRADFEIYVQDYDLGTSALTLQILNVAEVDVKAVTIIIPEQENIILKSSNTNIVGDLDSNEYTTANFNGVPLDGEIILNISYTDQANVRRNIQKSVNFNSKYFESSESSGISQSLTIIILVVVIILLVTFWLYRRNIKKKRMEERRKRIH